MVNSSLGDVRVPIRSSIFQIFPWPGGVNTSVDATRVPPEQVIQADNIVIGPSKSKGKRQGIDYNWDDQADSTSTFIGLHDFYYDNPSGAGKIQRIFALDDSKNFYTFETDGTRVALVDSSTAYPNAISTSTMESFNNAVIVCTDGANNQPKRYKPATSANIQDLPGSPPNASVCRAHLGRLWLNDKDNLDRLHYSTTFNEEEWEGTGDSGALDIGIGDGDPEGITAIFPTFKGDLFVAKKTKLYRITGTSPETFRVILVSDGIGCTSHNSVAAIDQDDIIFQSLKGYHSLAATAQFGDFKSAFISKDIQGSFNDNFVVSRLKYSWGGYIPELNSYAIAVTDSSISSTANEAVWIYNILEQQWFRWPNVDCASMVIVTDSDKKRPFFGGVTTRVGKGLDGTNSDTNTSGTSTSIDYLVKTGFIYVDSSPYSMKAFKRAAAIYKPDGAHQLEIDTQVDGGEIQTTTLNIESENDLLGSTFILDQSVLNAEFILEPRTVTIDGYGRGIQLTFTQDQTDQKLDLQGFSVEWEPAGVDYKTVGDS